MIALIPARGGSKGVPDKNIRSLAGQPLIAYSIAAAKKAKHIHRVVVSTDSKKIADFAVKLGAEVPFLRSPDLAKDDSLAVDVYLDAIERLSESGEKVDSLCVLQPTSPLRVSLDIDQAIKLFEQKNADAVISVCRAPRPVSWYRRLDGEGRLTAYQETEALNRQAEEVLYVPNGAIYVLRAELLRRTRSYYSEATFGYIMPAERSVDIDEPFDFEVAELLIGRG